GVDDPAFAIHTKAFRKRFSAPALHFARLEIDRLARELAFGLRRRRGECSFRRSVGPRRLNYRLKDRNCDMAAGRAAAERAALAVGIVVADPDRDGNVVGESHKPGVVLVVRGARLARDVGGYTGDGPRRAPS